MLFLPNKTWDIKKTNTIKQEITLKQESPYNSVKKKTILRNPTFSKDLYTRKVQIIIKGHLRKYRCPLFMISNSRKKRKMK